MQENCYLFKKLIISDTIINYLSFFLIAIFDSINFNW